MTDHKRDLLLRAFADQREAEDGLVADATDDERNATGTLERWSLRDNIAHIAHWRRHLTGVMAERRRSGPGIDADEFDAENAQIHAVWRDRPFDVVESEGHAAGDAMAEEIGRWGDAAFDNAWSDDESVLNRIAGNSIWHPASHLSTWLFENGRIDQGRAMYAASVHRVMSVDHSERAQGTALYNLACFDALGGNRDAALTGLARAFEKRPDLLGWASEDSDLALLHDDPAFLALLPQH